MTYALGVDLGTTYTAAAVGRSGTIEVVTLGPQATVVPSAVFVPTEGEILVGAAALRRSTTEPDRLAREFKRRMGDSVPLIVGGSPWSAEALTAKLLSWVVGRVTEQEGGPPASVTVTYPANWGEFKQDRLAQALRIAGLDVHGTATLTEPEAAALSYAAVERVPAGQVIAIYDLGGGTFDAAVLRKDGAGFELLGPPEGVERLGGIDIDAAVFAHVRASLGKDFDALDSGGDGEDPDPATAIAVARLRADCVDAKEALSSDTQVSIPVVLPGIHTEVRLTRAELEGMARPLLEESMAALRRAIRAAGLAPEDVDRVLLVGGASRMPLVGRMVSETLGRPFFVDANPKHAVALGATLRTDEPLGAPSPPSPDPALPAPAPSPIDAAPVPPAPSSISRLGLGLAATAMALVLVLVAVMVIRPRGDAGAGTPSTTTEPAGSPTETSAEGTDQPGGPPRLELTASTSVDDATAVAVNDANVWVASSLDGILRRFDTELESEDTFGLDRGWYPSDLVATDDAIWVVATRAVEGDIAGTETELQRRDPDTAEVVDTVPIGQTNGAVYGLAASTGSIWLLTARLDETGANDNILVRVNTETAESDFSTSFPELGPSAAVQTMTANDDRVWVTVADSADSAGPAYTGRILAFDPATNAVVEEDELPLGDGAAGHMALAPSGLWVIHWDAGPTGQDLVIQLDPSDGERLADVDASANQIAATDDWVWLWNASEGLGDEDTLLLVDPAGPEGPAVVDELVPDMSDLTSVPDIAVMGDTAWVAFGSEVLRFDISR